MNKKNIERCGKCLHILLIFDIKQKTVLFNILRTMQKKPIVCVIKRTASIQYINSSMSGSFHVEHCI